MKGWVYIISTRTHDLLKIGYTDRDPDDRARELNDTSSPHPHIVEYAALLKDPYKVEQAVHKYLASNREGKEWFNCSLIQAVTAIREKADVVLYEELSESAIRVELPRQEKSPPELSPRDKLAKDRLPQIAKDSSSSTHARGEHKKGSTVRSEDDQKMQLEKWSDESWIRNIK